MKLRIFVGLFCFCFVNPAVSFAQNKGPSLEDYGKLPDFEDAAISPDGKRYAVITKKKGERILMLVEDKKSIGQIALEDEKIRSLSWLRDDLVMLTLSRTEKLAADFNVQKAEFRRTLFFGTDGKVVELFAAQKKVANIDYGFYGMRETEGKRFGFYAGIPLESSSSGTRLARHVFAGGNPALYRVDLTDFSVKKIAGRAQDINDDKSWLIDARGNVFATLIVSDDGNWRLSVKHGKRIFKGTQPQGRVYMAGLLDNGKHLVLGEAEDGDRNFSFSKIDLELGTQQPYLRAEKPRWFYVNHLTGEIFGYSKGDDEAVFFDPIVANRRAKIRKAFPNLKRRIIDYDDAFTKVVLETSGNKDSGTFWQVDLKTLKASPLAFQRSNIWPDHVGKISTISYKASDGLEMDGILTLPPDREAKNLPVIMLPHGGPRSHDEEQFDWWAQSLASKGYAVFQPNFRGSTGRGQAFVEAGYGEWGRKMQTDISDGLSHLAKQGVVDSKRACIVGASYGGYAALAGVALQKDIYRCAVSVNGVSDLPMMVANERRESSNNQIIMEDLKHMVGTGRELKNVSPRRFAENIEVPLLLIHGKDDTVVPFKQSKVMANALKDAGKRHEIVTLKGEDHWLSRGETRHDMLKTVVAFLMQHNPPN